MREERQLFVYWKTAAGAVDGQTELSTLSFDSTKWTLRHWPAVKTWVACVDQPAVVVAAAAAARTNCIIIVLLVVIIIITTATTATTATNKVRKREHRFVLRQQLLIHSKLSSFTHVRIYLKAIIANSLCKSVFTIISSSRFAVSSLISVALSDKLRGGRGVYVYVCMSTAVVSFQSTNVSGKPQFACVLCSARKFSFTGSFITTTSRRVNSHSHSLSLSLSVAQCIAHTSH